MYLILTPELISLVPDFIELDPRENPKTEEPAANNNIQIGIWILPSREGPKK